MHKRSKEIVPMQYVLRPASMSDIEPIQQLLTQAHDGITNLPEDLASTEAKIELSLSSFHKDVDTPEDEFYLFILEDLSLQRPVGLSAIKAKAPPLYFFRRDYEEHRAHEHGLSYDLPVLQTVFHDQGPSEMCSLFLDESRRGKGAGALLSLGRFLYVAHHRRRFSDTIIAELRGIIHEDGSSPFYDGVGRHFFHMPFMEALSKCYTNPSLISRLLPHSPIYIDLLQEETQKAIGATHTDTERARSLLKKIGFTPTDEYDIFDGGPKLAVRTAQCSPIRESCAARVFSIIPEDPLSEAQERNSSSKGYIATTSPSHFRAAYGYIDSQEGGVVIERSLAEALGVSEGDMVRIWKRASTV